jgi:hypothetical protein
LLVWDKDSYIRRFLALFPRIYVLHICSSLPDLFTTS